MTFGEKLRELRERKGMTQVALAELVGLTKQNINKYETGLIDPFNIPPHRIAAMAEALDVQPAYLIGWDQPSESVALFPEPEIAEDTVEIPVIGEVAAGYDHFAEEVWSGESVSIPVELLHGRPKSDYYVLNVKGESMYPMYLDGDKVLVLKADTLDHSGQIGLMLYNGNEATLKKVEYVMGEDWLRLVPLNPLYPPMMVEGADLEQCRVLGIPKLLIREIDE